MEQERGEVGGSQSAFPQPRPRAGRTLVRVAFVLIALIALVAPAWVFFSQRGGLAFLEGADLQRANRLLFPLVGLYAFTLVWLQVMIGSNSRWLRSFFPNIIRFHRIEGVFALLFALTHPTLLIFGYGLDAYLKDAFVTPDRVLFVWFGRVALFFIAITAGTALLRKVRWLKTRWHAIHFLNYVIFVLVWAHSWNLGSDVQSTGLRWLWITYGITFVASVIARFARRAASAPAITPASPVRQG